MKPIPQTINKHTITKFQAWSDTHVNFPYHVRAPLVEVQYMMLHTKYQSLGIAVSDTKIFHVFPNSFPI